jgi:hypothetical protein
MRCVTHLKSIGPLIVMLGLASCDSTSVARKEGLYVEPAHGSDTAVITGEHQIGISISGYCAFLRSVDGKRVANAENWRDPHLLSTGTHSVTLEYSHLAYHIGFERPVEIEAQHIYHIEIKVKKGYHVVLDRLRLWLFDETESKVVAVFFDGEVGDETYVIVPP